MNTREIIAKRAENLIGSRFSLTDGRGYNCLTLMQECFAGFKAFESLPEFSVFSIGEKMDGLFKIEAKKRGFKKIKKEQLKVGDIIYSTRKKRRPHFALFIGGERVIQATKKNGVHSAKVEQSVAFNYSYFNVL